MKKLFLGLTFFAVVSFFGLSGSLPSTRAADLSYLSIDFGSPSATLPLDRFLLHQFKVKNTSTQAQEVAFTIYVQETKQEIVGWPQPQTLYLAAGAEQKVQTFLDERWGELKKETFGRQDRTVEFRFEDQKTRAKRTETVKYSIESVDPNKVSGDITLTGKVVDSHGEAVSNAQVTLSTGPGGFSKNTSTSHDGSFTFSKMPSRSDWVLQASGSLSNGNGNNAAPPIPLPQGQGAANCEPPPAPCNPPAGTANPGVRQAQNVGASQGMATAFIDPQQTSYTLKLQPPQLEGEFAVKKTINNSIGFWKGDVDSNEKYVLLINGMENWQNPNLKDKSKLYLYTLDGEQKWAYDMGWEGWGVDLSADAKYAAFATSNQTKTVGLIDVETGKAVWTKKAGDFEAGRNLDSKEVAISARNKFVAVGDGIGKVYLTEISTGKVLWQAHVYGQARGLVFDEADQYLYVGSGDGNAYKLNTSDGSIVWKQDIGSWPFANGWKLSKDGKLLGSGSKVGEVTVIDTSSGKQLWQYHQLGNASWVDFSPDGKYLVAGGGGQGATTLYEATSGKRVWKVEKFSHEGKFSADGKYIIMGDVGVSVVDLAGNVIAQADTATTGGGGSQGQFAYVSRDGTKLVFTHRDVQGDSPVVAFASGSLTSRETTQLTATEESTGLDKSVDEVKDGSKPATNNTIAWVLAGVVGAGLGGGAAYVLRVKKMKKTNPVKQEPPQPRENI